MISTVLNRQVRGSEKIVNYSMMRSISLPLGLSRPRLVSSTPPWSILAIFFRVYLCQWLRRSSFKLKKLNEIVFISSGAGTKHCIVFQEASASWKTHQWTGRRKDPMDSGQRLCERPNVFFGSAVGSFESKLIKFDLYCNVQFNSIREPRCELMFLMSQVGSQIC